MPNLEYPLKNFTPNYKNLKKKIDELWVQVDFDNLKSSMPCTITTLLTKSLQRVALYNASDK